MARPSYKSGEMVANERILNAFWELLAEKPYERISVGDISSRASVSRNTFYYHFRSLEDLVSEAVAQLSPVPLFRSVLTEGRSTEESFDELFAAPEAHAQVSRFALLLGPHSSMRLQQMARYYILLELLENCGIDGKSLSKEDLASFSYAAGGVFSVISDCVMSEKGMAFTMAALSGSEVVRTSLGALVDTIKRLVASGEGNLRP